MNIRRDYAHNKYVQEKGYYKLLVLLSMFFVHLFVHTRVYDNSAQVDVEPVLNEIKVFKSMVCNNICEKHQLMNSLQ